MAKVLIPTPLRQYADKKDSVELNGSTVGEVLGALTAQFPDLRKQIYNDEGKLRSFVNVYLNDEDIRYLKKDATPVAPGDILSIVPSIAGGSTSFPQRKPLRDRRGSVAAPQSGLAFRAARVSERMPIC
jgi:molybdopterin converting factor small subunit